ncbi:MAG: hypothetical protein IRY88_10245 [Rubrobacteraceae bacterium]|nr:hypothetical protein [Rubrobacteraceae bacterium]
MSARVERSGSSEAERFISALEDEFELMMIWRREEKLVLERAMLALERELVREERGTLPGGKMRWLRSPRRYWRALRREMCLLFGMWVLESRLSWCREVASEIEFGLRLKGIRVSGTPR